METILHLLWDLLLWLIARLFGKAASPKIGAIQAPSFTTTAASTLGSRAWVSVEASVNGEILTLGVPQKPFLFHALF